MRDFLILFVHLIGIVVRLAKPGGLRSVVAESVLVRHQLLILNRAVAAVAGSLYFHTNGNIYVSTSGTDRSQPKSAS